MIAENRHAVSEPATVRLRWKGAVAAKEEFQIKPKLYVLAVGVSQYQDAELRLGLAAKDALDFSIGLDRSEGTTVQRCGGKDPSPMHRPPKETSWMDWSGSSGR